MTIRSAFADGDVWGPYLLPHDVIQPQLSTVLFQQSNLNFMEALLYAYDIVHRVPAHNNQQDRQFGSARVTDLAKTCS